MISFAAGLNFYKLFWCFFICCFLGVVLEEIWFFLTKGIIASRQGLVLGPFNLVYGLGAVLITLGLYPIRDEKIWVLFLVGMSLGSLFEYISSLVQQILFGSVSWDYSKARFSLHGRIDLIHTIYWGILAVCWILILFPAISAWIEKIPNQPGLILSWILIAFMAFNICFSYLAVYRMAERNENIPAEDKTDRFFDEHYPDSRMHKMYGNMEFVGPENKTLAQQQISQDLYKIHKNLRRFPHDFQNDLSSIQNNLQSSLQNTLPNNFSPDLQHSFARNISKYRIRIRRNDFSKLFFRNPLSENKKSHLDN